MQLQKSEDIRIALVAGLWGNERYSGIDIPQLPDKGVNGWCISRMGGMVIPVFTSNNNNNNNNNGYF